MTKISEHLVQAFMEGEYDRSPLNRASFPVNMRLFRGNDGYRKIILDIVRYMDEHLRSHFDDYPDPRGIAAANLGFPFKIIGYKKKGTENQFCLNPKITYRSPTTLTTQTNCGSLRLEEPISVERHITIDMKYYDLEGNTVVTKTINRFDGGFTIQNTIDQCNGVTIIDKRKKDKK